MLKCSLTSYSQDSSCVKKSCSIKSKTHTHTHTHTGTNHGYQFMNMDTVVTINHMQRMNSYPLETGEFYDHVCTVICS